MGQPVKRPGKDVCLMRLFMIVFCVVFVSSAALASTISSEKEVIRLDDTTEVDIMVNYSSFTADQVSILVPTSHEPQDIEAEDRQGSVDCSLREQYGKEILCDPGEESGQYDIRVSYSTPLPAESPNGRQYSTYTHPKRFLVPTEQYSLTVVLPEGYGTVEETEEPKFEPAADTSSEGRRIFVEWENKNISLGDSQDYVVRYQELNVFQNVVPESAPFMIAFVALIIAIFAAIYVRRGQKQDTIASIMPVLKEDEQEVMRYIVDEGGDCEQRDLVETLSYSKAKISNLVNDLVDRNLIEKIKEGRTNRLVVMKEIGDID